jgi:hypothetical protein
MPKTIDYKQKYYALRDQMIRSVDFAYRMGFEAAMKEAQIQQAQMQMQQAQMQMQQAQGMMGSQMQQLPQDQMEQQQIEDQSQEAGSPESGSPEEQMAQEPGQEEGGSELDQHIQALEEAISKSEGEAKISLQKSLDVLKKTQRLISKDPSPFKLTKKASEKLSLKQKEQLSMQQEILNNILAKWEKEGQEAVSSINQSLGHILTKCEHEHD